MRHYASQGFSDFTVALGYKGELSRDYFVEYSGYIGSMSVNLSTGDVKRHERPIEDWNVHLIDTGLSTNTGGRVLRLEEHLQRETFQLTYGDGVSDVDVQALVRFHRRMGRTVTLTAVRPPHDSVGFEFDGDDVVGFAEKPQTGEGWINGGFMVCEPKIFDYFSDDSESLEAHILERLAADGQLAAYRHPGFWQCMDTLHNKRHLEQLWESGNAPWATDSKSATVLKIA